MSFFIADAYAQAAPAAEQPSLIGALLPFIVLFVVFYFLLIRPQQKRAKEHKKMIDALGKGDEVITQGGIAGRVSDLGESFVEIEVADEVKVKVQRVAISAVLPKGSLKSL